MFPNVLVEHSISMQELRGISEQGYGFMVKAVVDLNKCIMVIGAELHVDEESFLLDSGSKQEDLWGINIFPDKERSNWIQFDSMINIRPNQNNKSRLIEDYQIQERIREVVSRLIKD